jgi:SPP1 gp7 family putative phage head morphogenesis protein
VRRRRAIVPLQPDAIRQAYFGELLAVVRWMHAYLEAHLDIKALLEEHAARKDHADRASAAQRIAEILAAAKFAFLQKFPLWKIERVLRKYAARTGTHQKAQLLRQVKEAIGIPLDRVLDQGLQKVTDEFVADNVALITTIPEEYFSDVEQTVLAGMKSGARAADLAADVQDRFGVAKSRAYLIARDQIGKFNHKLDQVRQTNVGVKRAIYHTVEDERVRDSHAAHDGEEFSWDDPPEGDDGPALEDIQCRCWTEPILDDLL